MIHGLLAVQGVTRKPGELPKCLVREAGPEPVSYPVACSSEYADVWVEAMTMEFDGLVEAGTFAEMTEIPEGCNVVGYFETFAPTPSATSNRLVAAMACKLDWDLRHVDVDQASFSRS